MTTHLLRAGQLRGHVTLVCTQFWVCSHGDQIGNDGNVPSARSNVQWRAARVRKTVDVGLTGLQEKLDICEGIVLNCKMESRLATVEILQDKQGEGGLTVAL